MLFLVAVLPTRSVADHSCLCPHFVALARRGHLCPVQPAPCMQVEEMLVAPSGFQSFALLASSCSVDFVPPLLCVSPRTTPSEVCCLRPVFKLGYLFGVRRAVSMPGHLSSCTLLHTISGSDVLECATSILRSVLLMTVPYGKLLRLCTLQRVMRLFYG